MQLPAVCYARRNHGKNKMSAKCLLQIICIQSVKEICELKLSWQKFLLSTLVRMLVESCTHLCSEANHLPRSKSQQAKASALRQLIQKEAIPPHMMKAHQARASAIAVAVPAIPVLVALVSTTPILPLLIGPLVVEIVPLLLCVTVSWTLMRTIARPMVDLVLGVRLPGRREGSASAFRINSFGERPKNVVHVAEDVSVNILLGQCKRLEGGVRVAENFEPVLDREDRVRRRKVISAVEAILEPE